MTKGIQTPALLTHRRRDFFWPIANVFVFQIMTAFCAASDCCHDWKQEIEAVIKDIEDHVRLAAVSSLESTPSQIFFNLTTIEGSKYTVRLDSSGFAVCGDDHDDASRAEDGLEYHETVYALMNKISGEFKHSFGSQLEQRLRKLEQDGQ